METNPYRAPQSQPGISSVANPSTAPDYEFSETELTAFAGGERYPQILHKVLNGKARNAGFNIWAALFGIQWYFYRKLYVYGLFSAALEIIIPVLFFMALKSSFGLSNPDVTMIAGAVLFLATRILIGYMANIALCLKAEKVIREVDAMNKDNAAHLRLIAHAGGVSIPSLLAIYVLMATIRIINSN